MSYSEHSQLNVLLVPWQDGLLVLHVAEHTGEREQDSLHTWIGSAA